MLSPIARAALLAFASLPLVVHAQAAASSRLVFVHLLLPIRRRAVPSAAVLSPVVVTAERGPQPLADAIPQTALFDQQDIADTTATDLPGLLQLAPGAQISRTGGPGSTTSLYSARRVVDAIAAADRRRAGRFGEPGRAATRADSARPDRSRRSGERQRVRALRLRRNWRRGAGVHQRRRRPSAAFQFFGGLWQLSHADAAGRRERRAG